MITLIENLPDNIIGYKYDGDVTTADYETVLFPAVEMQLKKAGTYFASWETILKGLNLVL